MSDLTSSAVVLGTGGLAVASLVASIAVLAADPLPPDTTYRPLPTLPFSAAKANDEAQKPKVMQRQQGLLNERYDLANRPIPGVTMSGGMIFC